MVTLRQIADAESRREDLEEAYLQERGWSQTCQTPGSFWVWTKMLPDGRVALVNRTQAVAFAMAIERAHNSEAESEEKLNEWAQELWSESPHLPQRRVE
jgi:hypothetical protein